MHGHRHGRRRVRQREYLGRLLPGLGGIARTRWPAVLDVYTGVERQRPKGRGEIEIRGVEVGRGPTDRKRVRLGHVDRRGRFEIEVESDQRRDAYVVLVGRESCRAAVDWPPRVVERGVEIQQEVSEGSARTSQVDSDID
jgi:hypothetical protein